MFISFPTKLLFKLSLIFVNKFIFLLKQPRGDYQEKILAKVLNFVLYIFEYLLAYELNIQPSYKIILAFSLQLILFEKRLIPTSLGLLLI